MIVDKLTGSSQSALSGANYSWASVSFDGRDASLTGVAPSEEDRQLAVELVGSIAGVRSVESAITIGEFVRELRAVRTSGLVTLSGKVPSEDTRSLILRHVRNLFSSDSLADKLEVQGGPEDATWTRVVSDGVSLLPQLRAGEMRLVNRDISLRGTVDKPSLRDSLRKSLADLLPEGYTSTTEISVPEAPRSLTAEECQTELANLVANRRITFASGMARLTPEASPILEDVVKVAMRCNGVTIEVGGYTDSRGDRDVNLKLSQDRAQAVVDYLAGRGIGRTSLVAKGYGQSNPVATNRTWEGRATNRRIEFSIIR